MKTSINELSLMTETEKMFRIRERMEEMYASNSDWNNVMASKWALAMWAQKGGN